MKVIYNQDQLERLAILGAKLSVSADGITRLDLELFVSWLGNGISILKQLGNAGRIRESISI